MTATDERTTTPDRSVRERLTHSARIALIALQRRDDDAAIDRAAARRITAARLSAGAML